MTVFSPSSDTLWRFLQLLVILWHPGTEFQRHCDITSALLLHTGQIWTAILCFVFFIFFSSLPVCFATMNASDHPSAVQPCKDVPSGSYNWKADFSWSKLKISLLFNHKVEWFARLAALVSMMMMITNWINVVLNKMQLIWYAGFWKVLQERGKNSMQLKLKFYSLNGQKCMNVNMSKLWSHEVKEFHLELWKLILTKDNWI